MSPAGPNGPLGLQLQIAGRHGQRTVDALTEMVRITGIGAHLVARGRSWYVGDEHNAPGLAFESLVIKLGENVTRVGLEYQAAHPEVPWRVIKGMRNRLTHYYEGTDYDVLWATVEIDFPQVNGSVRRLLGG